MGAVQECIKERLYFGTCSMGTVGCVVNHQNGLDEAVDQLRECSRLLGLITVLGTLRPTEELAAVETHDAVQAMLRVLRERDEARARVTELESELKIERVRNGYDSDMWARTITESVDLSAMVKELKTERDEARADAVASDEMAVEARVESNERGEVIREIVQHYGGLLEDSIEDGDDEVEHLTGLLKRARAAIGEKE